MSNVAEAKKNKMGEVILTMKNIKKSFSGVAALKNCQLELRRGEVVALMGENGAGKSTLMKILTGIYTKDEGSVVYEGKEVDFSSPAYWGNMMTLMYTFQ